MSSQDPPQPPASDVTGHATPGNRRAAPETGSSGLQRVWPAPGALAPPRVWGLAAAAGLVAAALVPGHGLGLGLALSAAALGAVVVPALVRARRRVDLFGVAVAVALVGVVAVRDATWVLALATVVAVGVTAVALTGARTWVAVGLAGPALALAGPRAAPWAARGGAGLVTSRGRRLLPLLAATGVAALLVAVFGLLFTSADPVFAGLVPDVGPDHFRARVFVLVATVGLALTGLGLAASTPQWQRLALPPGRPVRRAEWLVPVVALDALVLAFVSVQVTALLGGHQHVLDTAGLTYAEYAREGFAQLLAATLLTLVVVAAAARYAPRRSPADRAATSAALAVLVLATVGVVVSALRRMDLYVDAFGLTRLRLLAVLLEVSLGVVLLLVLSAGVRWRGGWLPRAVTGTAALALLSLAVLDPDAVIAERNVERYRLGAEFDVVYAGGLSADAVPSLDALPEPLRSCTLQRVRIEADDGWEGWNLGRQRALDLLRDRPVIETTGSTCPR